MSNWALLQEQLTGKQVVKRALHGIHFDNGDGQTLAHFSGKPCHYLDGGIYKPIDTKLLLMPDGFYGCPHSPVRIHKDGHVKVDGTDYQQYTELPSATGLVDNDRIVREFSFGKQEMRITENGYRSEITLNRIPTLKEARKVITSESGTLSKKYLKSLTTATDANGDVHTVTTLTAFRTWLASAKFPVVIDPDFGSSAADTCKYGQDTTYATAHSTYYHFVNIEERVGQRKVASSNYYCFRMFLGFDTSSIPDDATLTQNNLKLVCYSDASTVDFDVQIVKQNWSSGTNDQIYDACLSSDADDSIWRNTNGMSINTQYTSGNLSTAWVNKTGTTYYSLRSNRDKDATQPADPSNEYIYIAEGDYATESYRPVLTVLYSAGGALLKVNMNAQMNQNLTGGMRG
jgi:hypothetical protein